VGLLRDFLPRHTYAVVGTYRDETLLVSVAGASIDSDDRLLLQFPQTHGFKTGDRVTVQLDSRTEVAQLNSELPVHRTSYKGLVAAETPGSLAIDPLQFQIFHSHRKVAEFSLPDFSFPTDVRQPGALPDSTLSRVPDWSRDEAETPLGVLFTRAPVSPHSTVMAFLSSEEGDIFLVTDPASVKAQNLIRDRHAVFAIDFRETYDLDKPLDWSYRLRQVRAFQIPASRPLYDVVKSRFLEKSPWNADFFTLPGSLLLHLVPAADQAHRQRIS